jgi:hypothetical protein
MSVTYSEPLKQTVKFPTLGEREFYEVYLHLANQTKDSNKKLVGKEIQLLAILMGKPLSFTLMFNQKNKDSDGNTINQTLAKDLGSSVNYILLMMKNLRQKGSLVVRDSFVEFEESLDNLRKATKHNIKNYTVMPFEYVFAAKVVEDE